MTVPAPSQASVAASNSPNTAQSSRTLLATIAAVSS
jgi:hypothetical protein